MSGSVPTEYDQTPELRAVLNEVRTFKEQSERGDRKAHVDNWNRYYALHRGYDRSRKDFTSATTENDRDEVLQNAKREWGAELFIPYVFAVIETIVPRALMNDPTMKVKPRPTIPESEYQGNPEAVKALFEERQSDINYSLILHPTARRGFKYGLGVQKTYWDRDVRIRTSVESGIFGRQIVRQQPVVISEGPMAEDVDIYDFFWPTYAKDMKTCDKALHRTWRPMSYIKNKVETGQWAPIDLAKVEGLGSDTDRGDSWAERMQAAGLSGYDTRAGHLHEIWEYHTGDRICTILDKTLVVQDVETPFYHRELPFQIFRPTIQESEFVGIGEIGPIEHLQYELNTMRSQRRDNATLILQKAFIYAEGMVDPADLIVGPGKGIPVYGDPSQVIKTMDWSDIPASGYEEESAVKSDMEFAVGISESLAGSGGSAATATGEQLVQAAANVRVQMKTKLLHTETLKPAAAQWLELWRQNIGEQGTQVATETPDGYSFAKVTSDDLWAVQAVLPEAGSTEPENRPQKVNDALATLNQLSGRQEIDQRKLLSWYLKQVGITEGEAWIVAEQATMNPQIAEQVGHSLANSLAAAGMDPQHADEIALSAMQDAMQATGVSQDPNAPPLAPGAPDPNQPSPDQQPAAA